MQKSKRHHYVWQYYLRPWTVDEDEKTLHCLLEGKIFSPITKNIGLKKDFHRIEELNSDDVFWLEKLIIEGSPVLLRKCHWDLIRNFSSPIEFEKVCRDNGASGVEFEALCDAFKSNIHEEYQTNVEQLGMPFVDALQKGDNFFYEDENNRAQFLLFLFTQYFRTNKIRENLKKQFSNEVERLKNTPIALQHKEFNIDKMWHIIIHLFAMNSGFNCLNFCLVLLENKTDIPFITSDQPAINLEAVGLSNNEMPKTLLIYYPISPQFAIKLINNQYLRTDYFPISDVKKIQHLNNCIVSESHKQIYSNSEELLEKYREKK